MWDYIVRTVAAFITLGLPLALFYFLRKKVQATWRLFRIGCATFVASQVVHVPLNMFVLQPLMKALHLSIETSTGASLWFLALSLGRFT